MKNKKIIIFITIFLGVFVLGCFTNFSMAATKKNEEDPHQALIEKYANMSKKKLQEEYNKITPKMTDFKSFDKYIKYLNGESIDTILDHAVLETALVDQDWPTKRDSALGDYETSVKEDSSSDKTESIKRLNEEIKYWKEQLEAGYEYDKCRGFANEYYYKSLINTKNNLEKSVENSKNNASKSPEERIKDFNKSVEETLEKIKNTDTSSMTSKQISDFKDEIDAEMQDLKVELDAIKNTGITETQKEELDNKYKELNNTYMQDVKNVYLKSGENKGVLYKAPVRNDSGRQSADNIDDVINDGKSILKHTSKISNDDIKNFSNSIFNIFLIIGVAVATLVGAILGVKFMTSSVEGKADVKKMLIVYVIGCVAVFGAFTIWKIVVTILQGI